MGLERPHRVWVKTASGYHFVRRASYRGEIREEGVRKGGRVMNSGR